MLIAALSLFADRVRAYPDSPYIDDRMKTPYVNRYYGHANELI